MKSLKKFFWTLVVGALSGGILLAWFSPYFIVWYSSPASDIAISCKPAVEWTIHAYRKAMFTGVLLGAIVSSIFFFAFFSRGASAPAPEMPDGAQGVPPAGRNDSQF